MNPGFDKLTHIQSVKLAIVVANKRQKDVSFISVVSIFLKLKLLSSFYIKIEIIAVDIIIRRRVKYIPSDFVLKTHLPFLKIFKFLILFVNKLLAFSSFVIIYYNIKK
jgi:hypothetical protein